MSEIKVTSCWNCPFANDDGTFGKDSCNHPQAKGNIPGEKPYTYWQLPAVTIHEDCPLKKEPLTVTL